MQQFRELLEEIENKQLPKEKVLLKTGKNGYRELLKKLRLGWTGDKIREETRKANYGWVGKIAGYNMILVKQYKYKRVYYELNQ